MVLGISGQHAAHAATIGTRGVTAQQNVRSRALATAAAGMGLKFVQGRVAAIEVNHHDGVDDDQLQSWSNSRALAGEKRGYPLAAIGAKVSGAAMCQQRPRSRIALVPYP